MNLKKFFVGRAVGLIIVLVVVAVGCLFFYKEKVVEAPAPTATSTPVAPVAENPEGEADPSRMTLGMNTWTWISAVDNTGLAVRPKMTKAFTVAFNNDGTFGVTTDCNSLGGDYVATKETIELKHMVGTQKACGDSQESEFATLLQDINQYAFTSRGELIFQLASGGGSMVFR